jgi:hypothetical protein
LLDGVIVDEVAGLEVVGGVEDEVGRSKQFVDVGGNYVRDVGVDDDGGVEESDLAEGGFGLRERLEGVGLVEENLALQVGGFYEVAVNEGKGADARAGEEGSRGSSSSSDADDGDVGGSELLLTCDSDTGK